MDVENSEGKEINATGYTSKEKKQMVHSWFPKRITPWQNVEE